MQASLAIPGDCVQLTALANASKDVKLGTGDTDPAVPDSIIPARKGGLTGCLWMANATDNAPALSPCQVFFPLALYWRMLARQPTIMVTLVGSPPNATIFC